MADERLHSVRTSSTSARSAASAAPPPPTSSRTRATPLRRFRDRCVATKTLSSTEISANTCGFWNVFTRPRAAISSGRSLSMASPFHTTPPSLAGASPAITLSSVVLPEPFGPMVRRSSPVSTPKETFETAMRPLKRFVRPRTSSSTARPPHDERADDPARHDEDGEDQDRAVQHRPQLRAEIDHVREPREHERADDRSSQRALAAEQHHRQDLHRLVDPEVTRVDVTRVVAVETAGERRERVAERERQELVAEDVYTEGTREVLVETDGGEAAPHPRVEGAHADEHREREGDQRQVIPRDGPAHGHEADTGPPHERLAGDDEAERAVGDGVPVHHDEPDHLRERQRHHREVERLQPKLEADRSHDEREQDRARRRRQERHPERQPGVDDQEVRRVRGHAEDRGMEHRELAREAEDQV